MTQQLTSPQTSQIGQNLLKFNNSSCCVMSPSQSNFSSHLKKNLVSFEQYKCQSQGINTPVSAAQIIPTTPVAIPLAENNSLSRKLNIGSIHPPATSVGIGKKKLTIQIDQNYDNNVQKNQNKFQKHKAQKQKPRQIQKQKQRVEKQKPKKLQDFQQHSSSQIDCMELISPISVQIDNKNIQKIYQLQQRLTQSERQSQQRQNLIRKFEKQNQAKQQKIKALQEKIHKLQFNIQQKNSQIQFKQNRIQFLQEKNKVRQQQMQKLRIQIADKQRQKERLKQKFQKQKEKIIQKMLQKQNQRQHQKQKQSNSSPKMKLSQQFLNQIQQKLKQKDAKIRQLAKINQKLKNLNKDLIRQVKISQKKVRDLQKQLQNNLCLATQQNLHRLKESSVKIKQKENIDRFNHNGCYFSFSLKDKDKQNRDKNEKERQKDKQRDIHMNTTKQKESSFAISNSNIVIRKSLQRKKNVNYNGKQLNTNTVSAGQLSHPKKSSSHSHKIAGTSSSNTILSKKLMHK